MTLDAAGQIETTRAKLDAGERGGSDADSELLLEFSDRLQLLGEEYSDDRHIKLLRHLMRISENVDGGDVLADAVAGDRDVAEAAVTWINANYDNPETNRDYRVSLRVLGRRVGDCEAVECDDNDIPRSISWVSSKTPRSYKPRPNAAEMVEWDEHDRMVDASPNSRDAAMLALGLDAGPRGGEFYDIKVGDLTDADQGLQLWVDGKRGERSVTLIPSVPYVNRWLADHPGGEGGFLWSKLSDPDRISRQRMYQAFDRLGERVDLGKKLTPTVLRKSNARLLAKAGANESLINRRQGRAPGSPVIQRYVAEFGEQSEQSLYAKLHGRTVDDSDEPERRDVVDCPRCNRENPPTEDRCMWCGQGLDPVGVDRDDATERRIREAITALARRDADKAETFVEAVSMVDDIPELRAAFRAGRDG